MMLVCMLYSLNVSLHKIHWPGCILFSGSTGPFVCLSIYLQYTVYSCLSICTSNHLCVHWSIDRSVDQLIDWSIDPSIIAAWTVLTIICTALYFPSTKGRGGGERWRRNFGFMHSCVFSFYKTRLRLGNFYVSSRFNPIDNIAWNRERTWEFLTLCSPYNVTSLIDEQCKWHFYTERVLSFPFFVGGWVARSVWACIHIGYVESEIPHLIAILCATRRVQKM